MDSLSLWVYHWLEHCYEIYDCMMQSRKLNASYGSVINKNGDEIAHEHVKYCCHCYVQMQF